MKKFSLWGMMLLTSISLIGTSCQTNELLTVEQDTVESRLAAGTDYLVQRVREGDADACLLLACRYRDGIGVPKSNINALLMHGIYCHRAGFDEYAEPSLFAEDHPFRPFVDMVISKEDSGSFNKSLNKLEKTCPLEYAALYVLANLQNSDKTAAELSRLEELEKEGSELSALFKVFYYLEIGDSVIYEKSLTQLSEKFPIFHSMLAEIHVSRYMNNNELDSLEKAVEHYRQADAYGMLTPKHARECYRLYEELHDVWNISTNPKELERLERIGIDLTLSPNDLPKE